MRRTRKRLFNVRVRFSDSIHEGTGAPASKPTRPVPDPCFLFSHGEFPLVVSR
jgi:hypothetical protein